LQDVEDDGLAPGVHGHGVRPGSDCRSPVWGAALEAPVDPCLALVDTGEIKLFFHPADDKLNAPGGTVAYFAADDFDRSRAQLLAAGCSPHRGPVAVPDGRRICQLRDPFDTIWGLEETDTRTAPGHWMTFGAPADLPAQPAGAGDKFN
jgi:hypothetical protein